MIRNTYLNKCQPSNPKSAQITFLLYEHFSRKSKATKCRKKKHKDKNQTKGKRKEVRFQKERKKKEPQYLQFCDFVSANEAK